MGVMETMAEKWDGHGILPQFVQSNGGNVQTVVPVTMK